jgi:CBS domain-containing protein
MRLVADYCSKGVVTARPDQSLLEVAQLMRREHVGCVVVVESNSHWPSRPVGILTDRDIVVRALAQTDRYLDQVRADDVMVRPVITVSEDDELADALDIMRSGGVRRLPVVNQNGEVVGLLSFDDLICHLHGSFGELAALLGRERLEEMRALPG